jgi:hypothetical protein
MRKLFPLFSNPIDLAHHFWALLIQEGDAIIDATCGNGKDALFLAQVASKKKDTLLLCIDIQEKALKNAELLMQKELPSFLPRTLYIHGSHEALPSVYPKTCKLIVYNLGYLPGGDKSITTLTFSTIKSISHACEQIASGGVISITCYPGHLEGKKEEEALTSFCSLLDPKIWSFSHFTWENRKESPSLLLIQKSLSD